MKQVSKGLVAMLAIMGGAVSVAVALISLKQGGYLGRSDFFDMLDSNADGTLSYEEWMVNYSLPMHEHPIEKCLRADFYHADCNQDDALTWREYHDFRFRRQECASAAVPTLRQLYQSSPASRRSTQPEYRALVAGRGVKSNQRHWSALMKVHRSNLMKRESELKQRYGAGRN